jgi:signal peptidase I
VSGLRIGAALVALAAAAAGVAAVARAARRLRGRYVYATVRGDSMSPTLHDGQRVRVERSDGAACEVGAVILFAVDVADRPGEPAWRVKRIAARAGDAAPDWMGHAPGTVVPRGTVAINGDNPRSESSRHLGFVAHDAIVGVVEVPEG